MTDDASLVSLLDRMTLARDERAVARLLSALGPDAVSRPSRLAFVNAHAVNLCCREPSFYADLMDSEIVLRDGSGMKILFQWLGRDPGLNLNGTDLIPRIIDRYAGEEAVLLGTKEPWLGRAAARIAEKGVRPVRTVDGFQSDRAYIEAVKESEAKLVILAMGMPRQEHVARRLAAEIERPCLIVCGGAILDFLGGKVQRAPVVFRRFGLEWLYRLFREPKRLFRRYVIGNAVFLFRATRLAACALPRTRGKPKVARAR